MRDKENEVWRAIPGYGEHYEASNLGRIRVKDRTVRKRHSRTGDLHDYFYPGRVLRTSSKRGYMHVHIGVGGERISLAVHRAVLLAFVGQPGPGQEGCHCNGVKADNRPENLRWDSHFENNQDRKRHGTYATCDRHPMAKFSPDLIRRVKSGEVKQKESGISFSHFYRIKKGVAWADLDATYGSQLELLAKAKELAGVL